MNRFQQAVFGLGALLAMLAVITGAIGSHVLSAHWDAGKLAIYETGNRYLMYHALGLLVLSLAHGRVRPGAYRAGTLLLITGVALFSGSLFVYTLLGVWFVVYLTPVGGMAMVIGWLVLALGALARQRVQG